MTSRTGRIAILGVGAVLAVLCSLSIHVVMLQVLGVPYPGNLPTDGLARLPDRLLALFGAATLYVMLPRRVHARPAWQQAALLFLLVGGIREALLRVPIMDIATASRWTGWPFLDALPSYLVFAAMAVAVVLARRALATPALRLAATLAIGVPLYLLLAPVLHHGFAGAQRWTAAREGYSLYNPPYDWHVEVPAYITFLEPVAAAFAVAWLVDGALPQARGRALLVLTGLLFALRGQFFSMFVNIAYAGTDVATAMLSFGQFTFESLALALVTATTWLLARPPAILARQ